MQFTEDENSRAYLDFDSINDALDGNSPSQRFLIQPPCTIGMCQMYEQKLKIMNTETSSITYDLADLITYLDSLKDLCCLTYNDIQKVYVPHGRDWIKSKIYMSLKKQAK